jgi:branched-subunit amino acid transport protein AzlD
VDFLALGIPAYIVALLLIGVFAAFVLGTDMDSVPEIVGGALIMFSFAIIEALSISLFGGTPGKALMGISVRKANGARLNIGSSVTRSVRAVVQGLALGIPIIALITHGAAFSYVKEHGTTGWDRDTGAEYSSKTVGALRWVFGVGLMVVSVALFTAIFVIMADSGY